jgi:hypothetical protein
MLVDCAGSTVAIDPIRPGFPGTAADLWVFEKLCRGVPQNSVRDAKYPGFFEVMKVRTF